MDQRAKPDDPARIDHPIESAPPEVREIIQRVLQREQEMLHTRKGVTVDDVVKIIKAVVQ